MTTIGYIIKSHLYDEPTEILGLYHPHVEDLIIGYIAVFDEDDQYQFDIIDSGDDYLELAVWHNDDFLHDAKYIFKEDGVMQVKYNETGAQTFEEQEVL